LISEADLEDEGKAIQRQIHYLESEIRSLRAKLVVPQNFRGLVGGTGLGYLLGGYVGAIAGAFGGYHLGKKYELNDQDKQIIQNLIRQKQGQINGLRQSGDINSQLSEGVMDASSLANLNYESYPFQGEWFDLIGEPSKPFHAMVFGRPKQGKSIFCFQFARYLDEFGPVLYVAAEEGFGGTLQKKVRDFGLDSAQNVKFSNARGMDQMRAAIPGNEFVFIDSVNYSRLEVEDVEALKNEFPETSFITIQQATKGGQFRGSQEYAHNCDVIIEVVAGVAYQQGRFQAASEYNIFDQPEEKAGENKQSGEKKQSGQMELNLFDL
jgi:predicted ATP-dependent serine protease